MDTIGTSAAYSQSTIGYHTSTFNETFSHPTRIPPKGVGYFPPAVFDGSDSYTAYSSMPDTFHDMNGTKHGPHGKGPMGPPGPKFRDEPAILVATIVTFATICIGIGINIVLLCKLLVRRKTTAVSNVFSSSLALGSIAFQLSLLMYYLGYFVRENEDIFHAWYGVIIGFVYQVSVQGTGLILMVMSYSRYRLVAHPLKSKAEWTPKKAWLNCLLCLIVSIVVSGPIEASVQLMKGREIRHLIGVVNFCSQFLLPLVWVCLCYVRIIVIFRRGKFNQLATASKSSEGAASRASRERIIAQNRRLLQITVAVVLVYVVTWGPFQILTLLLIMRIPKGQAVYPIYTSFSLLAVIGGCVQTLLFGWKTLRSKGSRVGTST